MSNKKSNVLGMNLPGLCVILLALILQACDKPKEEDTATLSVRLSSDAVAQLNDSVSSRGVSGKPSGVNRIIISVENLTTSDVIGSGDILQSNNSLSFTVPAHVKMKLIGNGYANNSLQFIGETEVPALRPGDTATPTLVLEKVPTSPPLAGRVLTGTLTIGGFGTGSTIELYRVNVGAVPNKELIAAGSFPNNNSNFSITLPEDTKLIPDSAYVFVAIDDINADPPVELEARFTNKYVDFANNTLNLNNRSTVVSQIITMLTDSGKIQDLSTEITLDEIDELDTLVADIEDFLGDVTDAPYDVYNASILTQVTTNLDYRGVASSIASDRQICGLVRLDRPDISTDPIAGIRIQVHDFDNSILRARATTKADGSYCVDVPGENESNAIAGISDSNGGYIVGAMNINGQTNAGSGWWQGDNSRPAARLRIDAEKFLMEAPAARMAAVINPASVDFILQPGVAVVGTVRPQASTTGKSGVTMIVRDSKTYFMATATRTNLDGSYEMHVAPGDYIIEALNTTHPQIDLTQNVSTAYYSGSGNIGVQRRNHGVVVSLNTNTPNKAYDMLLTSGIYVTGWLLDSIGNGIPGERVVINMSTDGAAPVNDGPATRLRIKNTDGSFGVWLSQYAYDIYTHGHRQYFRINSTPPGTSFPLPNNFAGPVATLPVSLTNAAAGSGVKLSQMKFELYNVVDGTTLVDTAFSRSDGSLTLYSNLAGDHILVGRLDSDRSTQRPFASTVYAGPNQGFTQRDIGERIPLILDTIAPSINFKPLSVGGTLTGTVRLLPNLPAANILVRVFHTVSNNPIHNAKFVQTRTRNDGTYTLSLPQATYDKITFEATGNFSVPPDVTAVCTYTPIFADKTTILDVQLDSVQNNLCTRTPNIAPLPYVQVGNAYFDSTTSADLTQHPLYTNLTAGWIMGPVTAQSPPLNYSFISQPPIVGEVSFTARNRNLDFIEVIDTVTDNLAIDIGGGVYSLGEISNTNPLVTYLNPVLQLPGELAVGVTWDISDGTDLANTFILDKGKIESFDVKSDGVNAVGNVHVSIARAIVLPRPPTVANFYFLKGDGLQEEIITESATTGPTVTDSWSRIIALP